MSLPLALCIASAAFILSGALMSFAYLKFLRQCTLPCCRRPRPADPERGANASGVADESPKTTAVVRRYGWNEVESLTGNFTAAVIGEGGFSTVYLARLPGAAVKVHRSGERLHRAFLQELDVLRRLRHPRIVRLLGFCDDREEGALVLEYVSNGSLHEKLHGGCAAGGATLGWARRMRIAYEVASAVEYLHEGCDELPIVHGDITAANVLLDGELDPKLCDFGSARAGFSSVVRSAELMVGSLGYADPHFLRTGMVSKSTDVYSFGVLLLELITGLPAVGSEEGRVLAAEMGPRLREEGALVGEVVDPRLGGEYDPGEAAAMAAIAARCVGEKPSLRPSMAEIRRIMGERVSSSLSTVDAGSDGKQSLKCPFHRPSMPTVTTDHRQTGRKKEQRSC